MASNVNAGLRVRVVGKIAGQDCIQVLHFGVSEIWNPDPNTVNQKLKDLANALKDCILTTLIPHLSSDYIFHRVEAQEIWPGTSDPQSSTQEAPAPGQGGPQGGLVLASLINIRTGQQQRRGRGRNFWPPAGENVATAGQWDPVFLAALAAFCACMAGKFIGPNPTTIFEVGVYSRTIDDSLGQNFQSAFSKATELIPSQIIATMGTRKLGKGS